VVTSPDGFRLSMIVFFSGNLKPLKTIDMISFSIGVLFFTIIDERVTVDEFIRVLKNERQLA
jgi:hypothetical protein